MKTDTVAIGNGQLNYIFVFTEGDHCVGFCIGADLGAYIQMTYRRP